LHKPDHEIKTTFNTTYYNMVWAYEHLHSFLVGA